MPRALLSVSDKTGIIDLARGLAAHRFELVSTGGTARASAKNFRDVLVVVDPADYHALLAALDATPTLAFRFDLMRKAIAHTAAYDTAIAATLATIRVDGDRFERSADASVPDRLD